MDQAEAMGASAFVWQTLRILTEFTPEY